MAEKAVETTKSAGGTISDFASKAKTPLIAGGTAVVGAAAGALLKSRIDGRSKGPLGRLGSVAFRNPASKLDLDRVRTAAERVNTYSRQAADIADAVEKTRKKNG